MNSQGNPIAGRAFTLIELLIVIAIGVILAAMLLPMRTGTREPAKQILCMHNLKQIGIGFLVYSEDNSNQPPWQVSTPPDSAAADSFLKLVSYLHQPDIFICPTDKARQVSETNYSSFSNTNLSYFAALQSSFTPTSNSITLVLAGDRHLALNNQPVKAGLLNVTNATELSWTKELHFTKKTTKPVGILLFADGHVARTRTHELPRNLASQDRSAVLLLIP